MSGVPDGLGAYRSTDGSIELFMNHELSARYDPSGSRISHLTLNEDGAVVAASYPVDGTENFEWFCSGTLDAGSTACRGTSPARRGEAQRAPRHGRSR